MAIYYSSLSTVIQAPAYIEWLVTQLVAEATFFLSCLISARVVIVNLILLFLLQIILSRITFNYISFEACLSPICITRGHTHQFVLSDNSEPLLLTLFHSSHSVLPTERHCGFLPLGRRFCRCFPVPQVAHSDLGWLLHCECSEQSDCVQAVRCLFSGVQ